MLSRIGARAALGVWRHRGGVLLSAVVAVLLIGYVASTWTGSLSVPRSLAASLPGGRQLASTVSASGTNGSSSGNDCADTAMAIITDKSTGAAHRAYQCMDTSFQQRVTEAQFVQQMQTQRVPNVDKMARVGDYQNQSGSTLVYYAVDGGGQSVGYIVYLNPAGKVLKIE